MNEARARAADWVQRHADGSPAVLGAFFSGSTVDAGDADELAPTSDVDVLVVVDGPAAKLGKVWHQGVLVEVTELPWTELADPEVVARTFYLAPSFAPDTTVPDTVITDPFGRLQALRAAVAPLVWRPDVVLDRCESVLARMTAEPTTTGSWARVVTAWLFPTSLSTNVVLVAARRNPTVRLRYLRARTVLTEHGLSQLYPAMLDQLGCREVSVALVRQHLDAMTAAFDDAAALPPAPFPFAADLTPVARPVAVDGARDLIAAGDHREAVFWLVATFARCVQALDAAAAPAAGKHREAFAAAVGDLLQLWSPADLACRRAAVLATVPALRATAAGIVHAGAGR